MGQENQFFPIVVSRSATGAGTGDLFRLASMVNHILIQTMVTSGYRTNPLESQNRCSDAVTTEPPM